METVGRGLLTREDFVDGPAHERSPLIFGKSEKMNEVERIVSQVANTDITVLLRGESGTGKELVAREICARSSRNCSTCIVSASPAAAFAVRTLSAGKRSPDSRAPARRRRSQSRTAARGMPRVRECRSNR